MNFATWSIRNPIPAILLFVLLTIAGVMGFHKLPIQNLPDIDLPTVNITLTQPGAAPAQLETEVARKVENSLATLSGLKHLRTSITDGQVQITVEFVLEKNLSDALIDAKNAVDSVRSQLPTDVQQPTVSAVTVGGDAVLVYAIGAANMDEESLSWFVDDTVGKAILAVPGVGRMDRVGGLTRQVRVEVDPIRMAAQGVTATDISQSLRNMQQESSGGRGQFGREEQSARVIAPVRQAAELAAFPVSLANGRKLRLDQIATIRDASAERTQIALLDGKPVVGFKVFRAKGYDETVIAKNTAAVLDKLQAGNPSLKLTLISGTVGYTREQYQGSL